VAVAHAQRRPLISSRKVSSTKLSSTCMVRASRVSTLQGFGTADTKHNHTLLDKTTPLIRKWAFIKTCRPAEGICSRARGSSGDEQVRPVRHGSRLLGCHDRSTQARAPTPGQDTDVPGGPTSVFAVGISSGFSPRTTTNINSQAVWTERLAETSPRVSGSCVPAVESAPTGTGDETCAFSQACAGSSCRPGGCHPSARHET